MNRSRILQPLLALAASLAIATPALAQRDITPNGRSAWPHDEIDGNVVDVQVKVDGQSAPLYFRPGANDRHYFQAFKGRNYSLVLRNTTPKRIGVLIAVDGLNVVSGDRSNFDRNEQMYVLDPWESTEIQGWRTSLDHVRRFVFVDESRSYAERTGQANGDMGWIRVAAYREVERQPWWGQWQAPRKVRDNDGERMDDGRAHRESAQAPMAPAPQMKGGAPMANGFGSDNAPNEAPGTGWGDKRYDPVQQTNFEAQAYAADQITLRYEYAAGLQALGIYVRQPRVRVWERERGQYGFAQPPRW